jgi:diketogulonate reductase-like aldo/keto reductase
LVATLEEIGNAHGASISQVALNWLVSIHGEAVVAIPGASHVRQAQESAGAMDIALSSGEMERIDELSRGFHQKRFRKSI